ncbi:MAG: hypothetical protein JNL48_00555 [Acidobacteria bacterium]|nr:hypothetical protein [Acidobacteriota bacterium]
MRSFTLVLACAGLLVVDRGGAAAQMVQGPAGGSTGIFGAASGSTAPTIALSLDFDGGYDDVSVPAPSDATSVFVPLQSGYVASGAANLRFRQASGQRYFLGLASGSVTQQQVGRDLGSYTLKRAESSLEAGVPLGRRAGLLLSAGTSVEPTYLFGVFDDVTRNSPLLPDVPGVSPAPSNAPAVSITEQRWLSNRVSTALHRNLTSRQTFRLRYDGLWVRPLEGPGFRSQSHGAMAQHTWNVRENTALEFLYRFDTSPQVISDIEYPLTSQTVEVRTRVRRAFSASRSLSLMAGGGAVKVRADGVGAADAVDQFSPTASGSLAYTLTRRWTLSLDARRDVAVLTGLSAEPFRSTSATLSLSGVLARRFSISTFGGYSRGSSLRPGSSAFDVASVNMQLVYGFTAALGAMLRYTYEENSLAGGPARSSLPTEFGRNTIRIGVTLWAPLYGRF